MRNSQGILWSILLGAAIMRVDAANLPAGFTERPVAQGLSQPTAMAFAPDGRLFICQQGGSLRVVKNGTLLARPFVTLPVDPAGERGLLGVAFDPSFAVNRYVYLYYTAKTPAVHNRVSRFIADGDTAVAGSETILLDLDNLSSATNHNGGAIHFGPDGMLYIAVGENAATANSQTTTNLLGKILRMAPDGGIPADNPFAATATGKNRLIWTLGLRNPFTFAFRKANGVMFINDVGAGSWEEINRGAPGANYGWPATEGATTDPAYRTPVFTYAHGPGSASGYCIAGGTFLDPPSAYPAAYTGRYYFADYVNGWIRSISLADSTPSAFATALSSPVDLQTGPDGNLYYLARGSGAAYVIEYSLTSLGAAEQDLPRAIALEQNYPNPFNGISVIRYRLPGSPADGGAPASVRLQVFDLLGRMVASLVDGTSAAGEFTAAFDAGALPSGTYIVRLQAGSQVLARTMTLIR